MRNISLILSRSFQNGGVLHAKRRVIRRRSWLGVMVPMNVLANGISPLQLVADLRLAIMELKMLLVGIILRFEVEWADECKDPMADLWSQVDPVHLRLRIL